MNKINKKTLYLFLDGYRWDYISRTPFINSLKRQGLHIKRVRPVSGFMQDIPMFAGLYPNKSNLWFSLKFTDSESPYNYLNERFYRIMGSLYSYRKFIPTNYLKNKFRSIILSKIIKAAGYKYMRYPRILPNAPLQIMPYLDVTSDKEIGSWRPGAFKDFSTLFDLCFKAGKKVNFCAAPVFSRPMNEMLPRIKSDAMKDYDISIYQITDLDHKVHEIGPNSKKMSDLLKFMDNSVEDIYNLYKDKYGDFNLLICGDHGMSQVENYIDIYGDFKKFAKENNVSLFKDYVYIIDSTHFRLKCLSSKMSELLPKIKKIKIFQEHGFFIDKDILLEYDLPDNAEYGDLIWEINHNSIIQPNFFNDSLVCDTLGMHGYLPNVKEISSTAIVVGDGIENKNIDTGDMVDIFPILCNLLGLEIPSSNQGVNYLER